MTSEPNREISKRGEAVAIISIAQHEMPIGIGQSEFFLAQALIHAAASSSRVVK